MRTNTSVTTAKPVHEQFDNLDAYDEQKRKIISAYEKEKQKENFVLPKFETKIIGFSGKKQAGKDTACNFLHALALVMEPLKLTPKAYVNSDGKLVVQTAEGDGILDLDSRDPEVRAFLQERIHPYIKGYMVADQLKLFCMNLLGLTEKQVYGTDEDKNTLVSHLLWENLPIRLDYQGHTLKSYEKSGPMTARENMQVWGTDLIRAAYPDAHIDACIRQIKRESPAYALVKDIRFPNEFYKVKEAGGVVIRFTRKCFEDNHASETALDKENFDWDQFDCIIDNQDMSIDAQNDALFSYLCEMGYIKTEE